MNEIVKTSPISLIEAAMQGVLIRQSTELEVKKVVGEALNYAVMARGSKADIEDLKVFRLQITETLQRRYGGLTLQEITYAAKEGSTGGYGKVYGVDPSSFIAWVEAYNQSTARRTVKRNQAEQKELPAPTKLNDQQKREFWSEAKADYKNSGRLIGELTLYRIGTQIGEIDTKDELFIEEVKDTALKWFKAEKVRLMQVSGMLARPLISRCKEVIEATEKERSANPFWQNRCKRVAVEITFKNSD